jgi:hypothetical protein
MLAARGSSWWALLRKNWNGVQSSGSMADETIVRVGGNVSLAFANVNPMNMGYYCGRIHHSRFASVRLSPTLQLLHILIVLLIQTLHILEDRHFAFANGSSSIHCVPVEDIQN